MHSATTWTDLGNGSCFSTVDANGNPEEHLHEISIQSAIDSNWIFTNFENAKVLCEAEPKCAGIHYVYNTTERGFLMLNKVGTPTQQGLNPGNHTCWKLTRDDNCLPGKKFVFAASRQYKPLGPQDQCSSMQQWKTDGCRTVAGSARTVRDVTAVKPIFVTVPIAKTIMQHESPLPSNTGAPTGKALCDTPFTITHSDGLAKLDSCGVWKIARTWKIGPSYADCHLESLASNHPLVTETIQIITVVDALPPTFVSTPPGTVHVPFLTDYGPSVTGVPAVRDLVLDPLLFDLKLASYPIQLEYVDSVSFAATPSDVCGNGLATVSRVWTTTDFCGRQDTWVQTIVIDQNPHMRWGGDASAYQIANLGGSVRLRGSVVPQAVLSAGPVAFHSVLLGHGATEPPCESGSLANSLVSGACPAEMEHSAIRSGSVVYHDTHGTCTVATTELNPSPAEKSQDGKLRDATMQGDVFAVDSAADLPVDTSTAQQTLMAMAELLIGENITMLLTGPQSLECTWDACTVNRDSVYPEHTLAEYPPPYETNASEIVLRSSNLLYNFFTVPLPLWFHHEAPTHIDEVSADDGTGIDVTGSYQEAGLPPPGTPCVGGCVAHGGFWGASYCWTSVAKSGNAWGAPCVVARCSSPSCQDSERGNLPRVVVKARGFVFVNVVDAVVIDKDGYITRSGYNHSTKKRCDDFPVRMGWSYNESAEHTHHDPLWNVPDGDYNRDTESKHYYHLKTRITEAGEEAQDPGTHMLVNVLSQIDDQRLSTNRRRSPRTNTHSAAQCAAVALDFSSAPGVTGSITGSHLVANPHSSLRVRNYTWNGGQVALGGGVLELDDTIISCGMFAANVQCPST